MTEVRIKETELPERGLIVVTAKLTDPNLTRPFETFTMCDRSGYASPIAYLATEAAALEAHDQLAGAGVKR